MAGVEDKAKRFIKKLWRYRLYPLGRWGVWLCNRCYPRPSTKCEIACDMGYVNLMINSLRGQITWYGRDRDKDSTPIVAERKDYNAIYRTTLS